MLQSIISNLTRYGTKSNEKKYIIWNQHASASIIYPKISKDNIYSSIPQQTTKNVPINNIPKKKKHILNIEEDNQKIARTETNTMKRWNKS